MLPLKRQEEEEEEDEEEYEEVVDEDCNMVVGKVLLCILFAVLFAGLISFTLQVDTLKAGRPYQTYNYTEVLMEGYYKNGKKLSVEARLILAVMREMRRNSEELKIMKNLFRQCV